jgi:hypothetical protein
MSAHQKLTPQSAQDVTAIVATGWSNPFLASAYYAVETAIKYQAQPAESPITEALARALTAIEDADVEVALYA